MEKTQEGIDDLNDFDHQFGKQEKSPSNDIAQQLLLSQEKSKWYRFLAWKFPKFVSTSNVKAVSGAYDKKITMQGIDFLYGCISALDIAKTLAEVVAIGQSLQKFEQSHPEYFS